MFGGEKVWWKVWWTLLWKVAWKRSRNTCEKMGPTFHKLFATFFMTLSTTVFTIVFTTVFTTPSVFKRPTISLIGSAGTASLSHGIPQWKYKWFGLERAPLLGEGIYFKNPYFENTSFCWLEQAPLPGNPFSESLFWKYKCFFAGAGSPTGGNHFQ